MRRAGHSPMAEDAGKSLGRKSGRPVGWKQKLIDECVEHFVDQQGIPIQSVLKPGTQHQVCHQTCHLCIHVDRFRGYDRRGNKVIAVAEPGTVCDCNYCEELDKRPWGLAGGLRLKDGWGDQRSGHKIVKVRLAERCWVAFPAELSFPRKTVLCCAAFIDFLLLLPQASLVYASGEPLGEGGSCQLPRGTRLCEGGAGRWEGVPCPAHRRCSREAAGRRKAEGRCCTRGAAAAASGEDAEKD